MPIRTTYICCFCRKTVTRINTRSKYCSKFCEGEYRSSLKEPFIEQGLVYKAEPLKRYLKRKRGYQCEICLISSWNEKPLSLHLDHIDGNSDNNFPSNIRLLCPNCHSQTDTFCSRNKKNSKRSKYNQRYRIRRLMPDVLPMN